MNNKQQPTPSHHRIEWHRQAPKRRTAILIGATPCAADSATDTTKTQFEIAACCLLPAAALAAAEAAAALKAAAAAALTTAR